MATETTRAIPYSPELDGLRAVSVVAVAYSHWLPEWQAGVPFGAGVHLFFVLSGFLITRILLGLRVAPRRGLAVARFYGRRVVRLAPAFVVVLGLAWIADVPLVRETWGWHAAYLSNVFIASTAQWQGHLSHFWSLAVEEQFYLAWPWLVVWLPSRVLGPLFAATILVGPVTRASAAAHGLEESFWALVPGGSADSLGLGAVLAWRRWRAPASIGPVYGRPLVAAGAAIWIALASADVAVSSAGSLPAAVAVWRQVAQGVVFAAIVERAVDGVAGAQGRWLRSRPLVGLGRISYGVYLVHAFAPLVVDALCRALVGQGTGEWSPLLRAGAAWIITVGAAAVMWRAIESPLLHRAARA